MTGLSLRTVSRAAHSQVQVGRQRARPEPRRALHRGLHAGPPARRRRGAGAGHGAAVRQRLHRDRQHPLHEGLQLRRRQGQVPGPRGGCWTPCREARSGRCSTAYALVPLPSRWGWQAPDIEWWQSILQVQRTAPYFRLRIEHERPEWPDSEKNEWVALSALAAEAQVVPPRSGGGEAPRRPVPVVIATRREQPEVEQVLKVAGDTFKLVGLCAHRQCAQLGAVFHRTCAVRFPCHRSGLMGGGAWPVLPVHRHRVCSLLPRSVAQRP